MLQFFDPVRIVFVQCNQTHPLVNKLSLKETAEKLKFCKLKLHKTITGKEFKTLIGFDLEKYEIWKKNKTDDNFDLYNGIVSLIIEPLIEGEFEFYKSYLCAIASVLQSDDELIEIYFPQTCNEEFQSPELMAIYLTKSNCTIHFSRLCNQQLEYIKCDKPFPHYLGKNFDFSGSRTRILEKVKEKTGLEYQRIDKEDDLFLRELFENRDSEFTSDVYKETNTAFELLSELMDVKEQNVSDNQIMIDKEIIKSSDTEFYIRLKLKDQKVSLIYKC